MFPEQDTHPPVGPQKFVTHLTLFVQPPTCVAHFFEPGRGRNTWPPATSPASLWVSSCTVSRCSSSFAIFGAFLLASFARRRVIFGSPSSAGLPGSQERALSLVSPRGAAAPCLVLIWHRPGGRTVICVTSAGCRSDLILAA